MKSLPIGILCSAAAMSIAAPVFAASDYLLVIDGVDGEASVAIEVHSWSWGASNPGAVSSSGAQGRGAVSASNGVKSPRDAASGLATGRSSGGVNVAAGDLDGDGRADLDGLARVSEVSGFSLVLAPGAATSKVCAGKHIKEAHIVARGAVYDFEDLTLSCTGGASAMTASVTGKTKEYKGHVTLMK